MRRVGLVVLSLLVGLPVAGTLAPTQAQVAKTKKKPATKPAPKTTKKSHVDPVATSYTAIPAAERVAIQKDLIWTGYYNGVADAEFGAGAINAVKAYQKRLGNKQTGVLNPKERATLAAAAKVKENNVGWKLVDDKISGARIGVPTKLASHESHDATGTIWTSLRGEVLVRTTRVAGPGVTLASVYEQERKTAGRRVQYNVLRGDFFVISGMQGLKKFYVRAGGRDGDVRLMTVMYDQAMEGTLDPVVIAMSSAFAPFTSTIAGPLPRPKVEYGTGIVINKDGYVLTDRQVIDECRAITLTGLGNAELAGEDKKAGLALLRVYGAKSLTALPLGADAPAKDVSVVGIADPIAQAGDAKASTVKARVVVAPGGESTLDPMPGRGFSGAATLDGGKLVGMAMLKTPVVAGPAPSQPQASLVPASVIRAFLAAKKVTPEGGDISADAAKNAVVRVICVRK